MPACCVNQISWFAKKIQVLASDPEQLNTVRDLRCVPPFNICWTFYAKLLLSVMDQEQPAVICSRAVLENILNNGKAHNNESRRRRATALTMRWWWWWWRWCGGWGKGVVSLICPPLAFITWEVLRTDGNQFWKNCGCLGFGEWLEIDQANGGEGKKPRPWASGHKIKLHSIQCQECCRLPPSSVFYPTHMARQVSLFN